MNDEKTVLTDEEIHHIYSHAEYWDLREEWPYARAIERAVIAQARAELIAELKPVAYLTRQDIDEIRNTGRHAVVIYSESVSPLDVPLAIIPTKENHE